MDSRRLIARAPRGLGARGVAGSRNRIRVDISHGKSADSLKYAGRLLGLENGYLRLKNVT
jgi:hypothetical protein